MKYLVYGAIILLMGVTIPASGFEWMTRESLESTPYLELYSAFREQVIHNYRAASSEAEPFDVTQFEGMVGQKVKAPMTQIEFGQPGADHYSAYLKALQAYEEGLIKWKPNKKYYELKSKSGLTVFNKDRAGKAVVIGNRLYLHDGNTKFFTSWFFSAPMMWVTITGYYPDKSVEDEAFMSELTGQGKMMLWTPTGERLSRPLSVDEIMDTPLRAYVLAHRLSVDIPELIKPGFEFTKDFFSHFEDHLKFRGKPDYESVIFAKVNGDPSYLEYLLAIAAYIGGYRPSVPIPEYSPRKRDTEYLVDAIRRGMIMPHPASQRLKQLIEVPFVSHHGLYPNQGDMTELLKNHFRRQARFEEFNSCGPELDPQTGSLLIDP
jgi:hypothetical protein